MRSWILRTTPWLLALVVGLSCSAQASVVVSVNKATQRTTVPVDGKPRPQVRLSLEGLPGPLWPTYDHLQPLQSLEPPRDLGRHL
jgi:hypothetical protein